MEMLYTIKNNIDKLVELNNELLSKYKSKSEKSREITDKVITDLGTLFREVQDMLFPDWINPVKKPQVRVSYDIPKNEVQFIVNEEIIGKIVDVDFALDRKVYYKLRCEWEYTMEEYVESLIPKEGQFKPKIRRFLVRKTLNGPLEPIFICGEEFEHKNILEERNTDTHPYLHLTYGIGRDIDYTDFFWHHMFTHVQNAWKLGLIVQEE